MKMGIELLSIAKMDLQASRVLYEKELYPQAIFYFQQSVEKACKAFALLTNQVTEKELPREVGHETIKIFEMAAKHQVVRFKQLEENLNKLPELKTLTILKDFDARKNLKEFERSLSEIEEIKEDRDDLIYISSRDIRLILKEIKLTNKDLEKGKRSLSNFKISERTWNKQKVEILEFCKVLLKHDIKQFEEIKSSFDNPETKLLVEISIKDLLEPVCIALLISVSLYYLSIITLPHSIITRYPLRGLTPVGIYTKKLPLVKMLPTLFEIQNDALKEMETLNKNFKDRAIANR